MSDTTASNSEAFERMYLVSEDEGHQTAAERAAADALARYREARTLGVRLDVDELTRAAPHAAAEIRAAVEAYEFISESGAAPPHPRQASAPERFPVIAGYQVLRVVGQGGMGVVYGAMQESLQRPVAIKVLAPHLEREPEVIARFAREIQLMTRLTHPNIVDIIDAGVTEGRHYYVMEYVDGLSLERILRKHRVRQATAVIILRQIVSGLAAAHKQGIFHRDLKPGNILLDRNAVVRIADFGLAAISAPPGRDGPVTHSDRRLGTVGYMSPEQMRDPTHCDERSDIFSVGVIFYQMLTGQLPHGSFRPASELARGTTRAADRLIDRCLQTDPAARYQSCDALLRSIGRLERRIERTRRKRATRHAQQAEIDRALDEAMVDPSPLDFSEGEPHPLTDRDLRLVIDAWSRLPEALRAAIIAIVRSAQH